MSPDADCLGILGLVVNMADIGGGGGGYAPVTHRASKAHACCGLLAH